MFTKACNDKSSTGAIIVTCVTRKLTYENRPVAERGLNLNSVSYVPMNCNVLMNSNQKNSEQNFAVNVLTQICKVVLLLYFQQ